MWPHWPWGRYVLFRTATMAAMAATVRVAIIIVVAPCGRTWHLRGTIVGMTNNITWQDPLPHPSSARPGRPPRGPEIVLQLQQRPGEWALVDSLSPKSTARLRRDFPGTEWVARDVRSDEPKLYGRWVGLIT